MKIKFLAFLFTVLFVTSCATPKAIDLMVSLCATDINSERKWKGCHNSLSKAELEVEWNEYW